jgi:hypothetical protein
VGPGGNWKQKEHFSFPGAFKTYTNLWEGKNLVIPNHQSWMCGRGTGGPWARWGCFELSPHQGVNTYTRLQLKRRPREREECFT